ncbi:hypothetical protein BGX38DRAFT_1272910 [Terfezia claveryi]|nr:hypothetical protein BGX38DRAFT_1272910 [Terfezia claveryi]
MAPREQVQYNRDIIRQKVWILYNDTVKKVYNSYQSIWDTVQRAQAAHLTTNSGVVIQPLREPLPDIPQLGQSTTGPSYMPQNPRAIPLVAPVIPAATPIIPTATFVIPAAASVISAAAPVISAAAPIIPATTLVIPVPPRIQQVLIIIPPLSLLASIGRVTVSPLAAHTCRYAIPYAWPTFTEGSLTSIRIHNVIPENYTRDVTYSGWFFGPTTALETMRILVYTIVELILWSKPFLPWELGAVRQISCFYVLDRPNRNMLDIQAEVSPPTLVPVAIGRFGGAGRGREGVVYGRGVPASRVDAGLSRGTPAIASDGAAGV